MNDQISLITLEMQARRFDAAEQLCREQLSECSTNPELLLLFAVSLHYQGKLDEAVAVYERLTKAQPQSSLAWGNYATALHEAGLIERAETAFRAALRLHPIEAQTLLNFGLLLLHKESFSEAYGILLRALACDPSSIPIRLAAARASNACGDYRARELIASWREWKGLDDDEWLQLARILMDLGEANAAQDLLETIIRHFPQNTLASIQLANVYERVNNLAGAEALLKKLESNLALDRALQQDVNHQRATIALRNGNPADAKALLLETGPRHDRDFEHYFQLAQAFDRMHDERGAMDALAIAHVRQAKKIQAIAPHLFEPNLPVLPQTAFRISDKEFQQWPAFRSPDAKHSPVFVIGFPRSGTTLLEQMLDAHPLLQSMDERPFFNILAAQLSELGADIPRDLGKLSQQDCDELRKGYLQLACDKVPRRWDAQLVDKNPLNMLWLPMISRLFPAAKLILALRHPCDVLLSCYMQNFRSPVLASACADLSRLATAYSDAMEHWQHHVTIFNPDLLVSRYEDLVADPVRQTRRIAEFLDLDYNGAMLDFDLLARKKGFIATPSYSQVIQPVNSKSLNRWRPYRAYFERVLPQLERWLDKWEYSID